MKLSQVFYTFDEKCPVLVKHVGKEDQFKPFLKSTGLNLKEIPQ